MKFDSDLFLKLVKYVNIIIAAIIIILAVIRLSLEKDLPTE
jgi:hypothetical protein